LAMEGLALVVRFCDGEKKSIAANAARAAIWWHPVKKAGVLHIVMTNSFDALPLSSPACLRPLHGYKLSVTLGRTNGEKIKNHLVDVAAVVAAQAEVKDDPS
jgi:hypothetical protein